VGEHVAINGHPTWVDDAGGAGDPMLLLHGGFSNSDGMEPFAPLADQYRLVAFDRRGHGRTTDTDAPFHYADMADETIGVLETVVGGPGHLVGYSDGGIVALFTAMQRSDLVRSLVLVGTNYRSDGLYPGIFDDFGSDETTVAMLREPYAEISPDGGDHFPVVFDKGLTMILNEPALTEDELSKLEMPVLVVAGDDDAIALAHTCSLYESLPNGQLAVIPGASHLLPYEKPAILIDLVREFLTTGGEVSTLMPARRAAPHS
jgi:pimeloyl-ACP methyl ester carboxylesterase